MKTVITSTRDNAHLNNSSVTYTFSYLSTPLNIHLWKNIANKMYSLESKVKFLNDERFLRN